MHDPSNFHKLQGHEDDDDDEGNNHHSGIREVEVREQDRFLPVANIARIMKVVLPGNAKIAKDTKETIQECVSEFISFITSEASDKCLQEKRKTINGDDLLWAMSTLGFDKYIDPLTIYLTKYRESVKGEKPEKKPPAATKKKEQQISTTPMSGHSVQGSSSQIIAANIAPHMHSSLYGSSNRNSLYGGSNMADVTNFASNFPTATLSDSVIFSGSSLMRQEGGSSLLPLKRMEPSSTFGDDTVLKKHRPL